MSPLPPDSPTLLENAMSQLTREGIAGLSFRGIAAVLDITPEELQRSFADSSAVEAALAAESSRLLLTSLQAAAAAQASNKAIARIAHSFVSFARSEPHVFALCQKYEVPHHGTEWATSELWSFLLPQIARVYQPADVSNAALVLWALLNGFTSYTSSGALTEPVLTRSLNLGLSGWMMAATAE